MDAALSVFWSKTTDAELFAVRRRRSLAMERLGVSHSWTRLALDGSMYGTYAIPGPGVVWGSGIYGSPISRV